MRTVEEYHEAAISVLDAAEKSNDMRGRENLTAVAGVYAELAKTALYRDDLP